MVSKPKPRLSNLVWVVLATFAMATCAKGVLNAAFDDFKSEGETESWSVDEARERGVLVSEWTAVPPDFQVPGGRVRFGEVWVEERALTTHRFVWFPCERRIGGYRLHFTLAEGKELMEAKGHFFYRDDVTGVNVGGHRMSDGRHLYIERLDDPDISAIRLSITRDSDAPRNRDIRFVHKPEL